ncbi:heavy-metal-associated domain-containing protein [Terrimonas rubra]|uniref:Heavy-metal-associated domain-containing protein n=1 Tax=Terrimonas rubra TaxID=1035890 RepID=A0ABW6A867_9BACT
MRNLLFTLMAVIGICFTAGAQTKAQLTANISTPDVACAACETRITSMLKRYDGVLAVKVYYKRGITQVKYLTDRVNIETIKTAIANAGYDADNVTKNEDAYKRLPKTCKKFEDGGGHPKPRPKAETPVADSVAVN